MKRVLSLLVLLSFLAPTLYAQHDCGLDAIHQHQLSTDPAYQQAIQTAKADWNAYINSPTALAQVSGNDTIYEIPVVVHVIHDGGAVGSLYNPSDADIQAMIATNNDIYASTVSSWPTVTTGGVDMKLRFRLATKDENCNPTNGINRIDASSLTGYSTNGVGHHTSNGPDDLTIKNLSRWDINKYYNIWLVKAIDGYTGYNGGGVAGYAYLPYFINPNTDGTIMLSKFATNDPDEVSVLSHELGHAFGLYHTFDGDNGGSSCPTEFNCATENDEVCDTDPHVRSFGCPSGTNSCTGNPYGVVSYNIMNYTNCVDRFTAGQRTKALYNARTYRHNLIHSATAVTIPSTTMSSACSPSSVNFTGNSRNIGPREVQLEQIFYKSGGYSTEDDKAYVDNTCHAQTTLLAGQTYNIRVRTGGNYGQRAIAYLDYNNDGVFTTAEQILSNTGTSGTTDHTASFTVPNTAVSCTPLRLRVIADDASSAIPNPCGNLDYGQIEDYAVIIEGADTVGIQITQGSNPSCPGTALSFAATTNSTNPITYTWKLNGSVVSTTATYSSSAIADGDVLTLEGTTISACNPGQNIVLTESLTLARETNTNVMADIQLVAGTDTLCDGESATLLATLQNATSPTFQWMVNGAPIGATSQTVGYTPADGDYIYCLVTDNNNCFSGTVNSDTITFTVVNNLIASATITSSVFPVCDGTPVYFNATTQNDGISPTYQWLVNGSPVGANSLNYTSSTLADGDIVSFRLTSSITCVNIPTVNSNAIVADIDPILPVSASTAFIDGGTTICNGDPITIEVTPVNGGTTPNYSWDINGVPATTGNPATFTGVNDGDVINVVVTSSENCTSGNPYTVSNTITVNQYPSPIQVWLTSANILEANPPATNYQWYGPNGKINGATSQTYKPTKNGKYYCIPTNPPCEGQPSNVLEIYILDNKILTKDDLKLFPNPADKTVTLKLDNVDIRNLYLVNTLGQEIVLDYDNIVTGEYKIDTEDLIPGLYMLGIQTDKEGTQFLPLQIVR